MTIEEVMDVAVSYGYGPRKWADELRASIQALVAQARDEEAEACIELCQCYVRMVDSAEAIEAIRARIAGRKA